MKVLILGGTGFIGERLADYLIEKKYEITIASRKNYKSPNRKIRNIIKINWNDAASIEKACEGIDIVIFAAGVSAKESSENLINTIEFSKKGTLNLINAAKKCSIKEIIYLSTAHVYCSPLLGKINENSKLENKHPYAISHSISEEIIIKAQKNCNNLKTKVLRLSNCFGRPINKDANCWYILINDICKQAIITNKIIVKSRSNTVRNFIPISTVIYFIEDLISQKYEKAPQIINIGEKFSLSINEVLELVLSRLFLTLKRKPEIIFNNYNKEKDYLEYETNILKELDFNKYYSFKKEIDNLILFCHENFE